MTWSRKQRAKRRVFLDRVREVMREQYDPAQEAQEARIEGLGAELAVATHLLHLWNDHHRADPEDWAAAARLRGTVQETAKFLGAELGVTAGIEAQARDQLRADEEDWVGCIRVKAGLRATTAFRLEVNALHASFEKWRTGGMGVAA